MKIKAIIERPDIRVARSWIHKFVNNKQMAFLQTFVSEQLLFLFSKHLDTMSNVTDCDYGQTNLWSKLLMILVLIFTSRLGMTKL